jgi:two-component system, OmpR family, response regulator VicR
MSLIMIADDEKDTRDSIKILLEKNGFKVIIAKNVKDCLKKLDEKTPDLILLDLLMPGEPVNELIENNTHIKFIIVSAYLSENLEKSQLDIKLIKSLESPNVVEKIPKPFNNDKLLELIRKNLK